MKQEEMEAIERRRAAATPGPWVLHPAAAGEQCGLIEAGGEPVCQVYGNTWCVERQQEYAEADMVFIAHAPADIDALLGYVAQQRQRVAELEEKLRPKRLVLSPAQLANVWDCNCARCGNPERDAHEGECASCGGALFKTMPQHEADALGAAFEKWVEEEIFRRATK